VTATAVAGDGKHQQCDRCGHVAPFADLAMYPESLGLTVIECRDSAACKARQAARNRRPDIHAVVAELANLGITAVADEPMYDDDSDDFCSLTINPQHLADSDADGMAVGWDADNGWTFDMWCDPPSPGGPCHLDPAEPAGPREVAAQVKAILDGAIDSFRAVCVCWGGRPAHGCRVHQAEYLDHLRAIGAIR
jgi:hypothetical protein